jgi:transcriptional regulator with XRE-family HTH domain
MEEIRKIIGARIAELRKKRGLSQRALAELTGYNPSNIARIELGRYSVGLDVLHNIADKLDAQVEINELK